MGIFSALGDVLSGRSSIFDAIDECLPHGGSGNSFYNTSLGNSGGIVKDPRTDIDVTKEMLKEMDNPLGELIRTTDDAKMEFHELITDGFIEMVIKGNSNYKTSFEIRESADEKINSAIKKYRNRCSEFNKYLEALNSRINAMYEKKAKIMDKLGQVANSTPVLPKIGAYVVSPCYRYELSTINMLCRSISTNYDDVTGRKNSAEAYMEDVKDFEVQILGKIAEINRAESFLNTVEVNLNEEEMLLDALNNSLNQKQNLPYSAVAQQLHILLTEYILDANGKKNERYLMAIQMLKQL